MLPNPSPHDIESIRSEYAALVLEKIACKPRTTNLEDTLNGCSAEALDMVLL